MLFSIWKPSFFCLKHHKKALSLLRGPQHGQRESLVLYKLFNTLCLLDALCETDLDEGAVLAGGALEGPGLLGARHAVHPDVPVLARRQDVLPTPEHGGSYVIIARNQCCGSGSGIRCLFDPWIRDGYTYLLRDEQPGLYFRELRNNFLG